MEIYNQLLRFPLFQGMSHADLMEVVGHTKLGFLKIPAGKVYAKEGDSCHHLSFLTHGTMQCETQNDDHTCRVVEHLAAPYLLQPEQLFGLSQRFTSNFKAETPCNIITIDKQEVLLLMETQLVFRLNFTNILSTEIQRLRHQPWRSAPTGLRQWLVRYFLQRCLYPAGAKTFRVLMRQIAADLNDSRLDISQELNRMQADGLLTLHRGRIEIPMIEKLLM